MQPIARLPLGEYIEIGVKWMTNNLAGFFTGIREGLANLVGILGDFLYLIPVPLFIIIVAALSWWVSGKNLAIFSAIGLYLIYNLQLWDKTVLTLSMVTTATLIALVVGLPSGILMSKSNTADKIIRPILDFMQTMPAFVYLIPAVYFFDLGTPPGVVATIIFAMPPIVRLTNLGIRQVPEDVVAATRLVMAIPSAQFT